MKEGVYLRVHTMGDYGYPEDVTERKLWTKEGLVLTDDNQVLFRDTAFYIFPGRQPERVLDGQPLYTGPAEDLRPMASAPMPWFPFCVEGKWGYGDAGTGEVIVPPQHAFCDYHEGLYARFSNRGDFRDLDQECQDGAWGMYDDGFDVCIPPVYQYLSCMQRDVAAAKRDGRWGLLEWDGDEALPFQYAGVTFVKGCVLAWEEAGGECRYSLRYIDWSYDYQGPKGRYGIAHPLLEDLHAVTVPEQKRSDGLPYYCRLIQKGKLWGVVDCVTGKVEEPSMDRAEAEALFQEWDDVWG